MNLQEYGAMIETSPLDTRIVELRALRHLDGLLPDRRTRTAYRKSIVSSTPTCRRAVWAAMSWSG